jgi:hypothetical protein
VLRSLVATEQRERLRLAEVSQRARAVEVERQQSALGAREAALEERLRQVRKLRRAW